MVMPSKKLDKLATDIDDAKTVVEELQDDADNDRDEKLDELAKTLDHAADQVDRHDKED